MVRRAPADAEPPGEAAVVPRGLQEVYVVHRHILKSPLVAERARLMQRVSQLTVASARSERQVFITDFSFGGRYVTRLNLLNTDIALFAFVIGGEIVVRRRAPGVLASGGLRGRVGPAGL